MPDPQEEGPTDTKSKSQNHCSKRTRNYQEKALQQFKNCKTS